MQLFKKIMEDCQTAADSSIEKVALGLSSSVIYAMCQDVYLTTPGRMRRLA
jgi:hypothetical protein